MIAGSIVAHVECADVSITAIFCLSPTGCGHTRVIRRTGVAVIAGISMIAVDLTAGPSTPVFGARVCILALYILRKIHAPGSRAT